ncbi:ankyrin repeat domain-containing protein, partial [bacterium]|nr:ankyrin repeat domain-containing protein [bacterium]
KKKQIQKKPKISKSRSNASTSQKYEGKGIKSTSKIQSVHAISLSFKLINGIRENFVAVLDILKNKGANINVKNNKGFTPLHIACKTEYFNFNYSKDIYVSKWLVDNGADVNARDTKGNTPVFYVGGDVEEFNLLKNHGAELSIQNHNGETPVFYLYGKVTEILISSGINVKHRDKRGYTPIHKVAEKLNINICKLLIANGADINAASNDGTTPLLLTLKNLRRDYRETKKVLQLLDLGASVNHADPLGNTPLHYAVSNADQEVYEKIFKKGGKLNVTNNNGETPLYKAISRGRDKAAIFLLGHNADPNIGTSSGDTPLLSAIRGNGYSLITELINRGADVNTPGKSGKPPLEVAVDTYASKKIIKELKRRGARKSPEQERKEFRRDLRIFLWRALEITVIILGAALFFAGLILIFSSLKRDPKTLKIRFPQPSRIILAILYFTLIIITGLNLIGRADILEDIGPLIIIITFLTPITAAGQLTFLLKKIKSRPLGWFLLILLILAVPCASDLMFLIIIIGRYQGEAGMWIGYWILIQS